MTYDCLDPDALEPRRVAMAAEVAYARREGNTSIPLELTDAVALALLLRDLAEIAMHAPGGHGFLIDEARSWARALGD